MFRYSEVCMYDVGRGMNKAEAKRPLEKVIDTQ